MKYSLLSHVCDENVFIKNLLENTSGKFDSSWKGFIDFPFQNFQIPNKQIFDNFIGITILFLFFPKTWIDLETSLPKKVVVTRISEIDISWTFHQLPLEAIYLFFHSNAL